jgi:hypothetical protein
LFDIVLKLMEVSAPVANLEEKKEGADGEEVEDVPNPMYERPVYLDPKKFTPEATLNV